MTVKKFYIGLFTAVITFIIGFIMISNNLGSVIVLGDSKNDIFAFKIAKKCFVV